MTTETTTDTKKPDISNPRLAGWRPANRGTLPEIPPVAELKGTLRKLATEIEQLRRSASQAQTRAKTLRASRREVERDHNDKLALAIRAGEPEPVDPTIALDEKTAKAERRLAATRQAIESAVLDFGQAALLVQNDEIKKSVSRRDKALGTLDKALEAVDGLLTEVEDADALVAFFKRVDTRTPRYRRVATMGEIRQSVSAARADLKERRG